MHTIGGMASPVRVCLQVEMAQTFGAEVALGVRAYALANGRDWLLNVPDWDEPLVPGGGSGATAAVIARVRNAAEEDALLRTGLPAVNVSGMLRASRLPRVQSDDAACGRAAAGHLLDRGFRSFAATFGAGQVWRDRAAAFARSVRAAGCRCDLLDLRGAGPTGDPRHVERLAAWLSSLPSPVGVMAASDLLGRRLSDACHLAGLAVPERVALVGVDNSGLMCRLADPPLSSVDIDAEAIGRAAAEVLDGLLSGADPPAGPVRVPPRGVVARGSSDTLAVADADVAAALRLIRLRACGPLEVADVLREVAVSRRSLEGRMRRAIGRTPGEEIRRVRVERAKLLLAESGLPLEAVAARSGFANRSSFSHAFTRGAGVTPGAFRRAHRRASPRDD